MYEDNFLWLQHTELNFWNITFSCITLDVIPSPGTVSSLKNNCKSNIVCKAVSFELIYGVQSKDEQFYYYVVIKDLLNDQHKGTNALFTKAIQLNLYSKVDKSWRWWWYWLFTISLSFGMNLGVNLVWIEYFKIRQNKLFVKN